MGNNSKPVIKSKERLLNTKTMFDENKAYTNPVVVIKSYDSNKIN